VSSAEHREIPPDIVCHPPGLPAEYEQGVALPIDKPEEKTSFDVVRFVRKQTGERKVGHAGTLDPMATGLLMVLVARPATRLQDAFMALRKVYVGTMRLGETTPSHDAETDVTDRADPSGVTTADLTALRDQFEGTINQVPPMYSAVKVDGERLYEKARRGETVDRPPRQVTIYDLEFTDRDGPDVSFRVECSKGTYVRSLARDVGAELGVGAHLTALRRLAIGPFHVDDAWSLEALKEAVSEAKA
jgi:tRNA pseudouridine55 synthase